jgi:hypothetical protein
MELNNVFAEYFNPCSPESSKVNIEICKKCGGGCCQSMGCHISPFDLKEISVESIVSLIDDSKCISIDWWNGNPITNECDGQRVYFLRIKNVNAKVIDPSFGAPCSILTDIGCPLFYEYRPKGARELIPSEGDCHIGYSKQECAADWLNYQEIMEQVYNYYFLKGDVVDSPIMFATIFEDLISTILGTEDV